jgi:phosphatidylserine decarboxylase
MKHRGKAAKAAVRILMIAAGTAVVAAGVSVVAGQSILADGLIGVFALFSAFTLYFFRDPEATVPSGSDVVVAPAHGTVDTIDEVEEPLIMGGKSRRISIFLSVFNVHVQQSPVAGRVTFLKHTPGQFVNALKIESAALNENVLIGFQCTNPAGIRVGVRLIAGLIARRIIPWVAVNTETEKGERISLIQFGSRVDVYLPMNAEVTAQLGQKTVGGETVIARIKR